MWFSRHSNNVLVCVKSGGGVATETDCPMGSSLTMWIWEAVHGNNWNILEAKECCRPRLYIALSDRRTVFVRVGILYDFIQTYNQIVYGEDKWDIQWFGMVCCLKECAIYVGWGCERWTMCVRMCDAKQIYSMMLSGVGVVFVST